MYNKPKNDEKWAWTNHVVGKMGYYRISESLVKRVVRFPKRVEKGIAPDTTACMQAAGSKKNPSEVWVMYVDIGEVAKLSIPKKKIITTWRYPGISPIGEPIPIPDEILAEIESQVD